MPKSSHMTIVEIEKLHINTRRKIHLIPEMLFFSIYDKNNDQLSQENHFRTVASPGACERLAVLN